MKKSELSALEKEAAGMPDELKSMMDDTDQLLRAIEKAGGMQELHKVRLSFQQKRYESFCEKEERLSASLKEAEDALSGEPESGVVLQRVRISRDMLTNLRIVCQRELDKLGPLEDSLKVAGRAKKQSRSLENDALNERLKNALKKQGDNEETS